MARKGPDPKGAGTGAGRATVGAAEFKARCLELMDRVHERGAEYIVTKHGRPVAKLVPCREAGRTSTMFGSMAGTVLGFDRPLDPLDEEYDVNR